jgi:Fuc2NAc and GlcNAc transferase
MTNVFLLFAGIFIISLLLTGLARRYAIANQVIDIPNARSSHTFATPRGGGISIVITFSIALIILYFHNMIELNVFFAFFIGGLLIGIIGFFDDHRHIPARWRIIVHIIAAIWAIYWLGNNYIISFSDGMLHHGLYVDLAALFITTWFLNLYNFMDGIDGIASIEAITTAGAAAFIIFSVSLVNEQSLNYVLALLLLLVAVLGFLVWNWPPAKIFMGDGGSGYLGYIFALFAISTTLDSYMTLWTWLILLGVFIVDASFTLLQRIVEGKRWYEAHRSHAYQHAAQLWNNHTKVTLFVFFINMMWLFPLAWLATFKPEWGAALTIVAYMPLLTIAFYLRAGKIH